jgi:hypothetical protein
MGHKVELARRAVPRPVAAEQTVRRYEELELGLDLAAAGA